MCLLAVARRTEQLGQLVGVKPEEDVAIEDVEPLGDGHIGQLLDEDVFTQRRLVTDRDRTTSWVVKHDAQWARTRQHGITEVVVRVARVDKLAGREQSLGADERPASFPGHVVQMGVVLDQFVDHHATMVPDRLCDGSGGATSDDGR